jgi:hypothetical protein
MQGASFEAQFTTKSTKSTKNTKGARCAPDNHNESRRLAARLWRAFVSFVLFVVPLQLLPAWVPAFQAV